MTTEDQSPKTADKKEVEIKNEEKKVNVEAEFVKYQKQIEELKAQIDTINSSKKTEMEALEKKFTEESTKNKLLMDQIIPASVFEKEFPSWAEYGEDWLAKEVHTIGLTPDDVKGVSRRDLTKAILIGQNKL